LEIFRNYVKKMSLFSLNLIYYSILSIHHKINFTLYFKQNPKNLHIALDIRILSCFLKHKKNHWNFNKRSKKWIKSDWRKLKIQFEFQAFQVQKNFVLKVVLGYNLNLFDAARKLETRKRTSEYRLSLQGLRSQSRFR
jgi:hypothetical protein